MTYAIILAAGIGKRLEGNAGELPKCLLRFNGTTLLERHLSNLLEFGINEIYVVTGYQSQDIEQVIYASDAGRITQPIFNPRYNKGSHISLLTGLARERDKSDFILMDADVLYDKEILSRLINSSHRNCFLLDKDYIPGDEPVKLCIRDGRIVEFRKLLDCNLQCDFQGESVGFFRFSPEIADKIVDNINLYLERGDDDSPYEEIIRDLLLENPNDFGFEDITGLPWIEIDFMEDIKRAKLEILPLIE